MVQTEPERPFVGNYMFENGTWEAKMKKNVIYICNQNHNTSFIQILASQMN